MESVIFDTTAHEPACFARRYDAAFHHAMSHAISQWWTTTNNILFRRRFDSFVIDTKLLGIYYFLTLVLIAIYFCSFALSVAYDSFHCTAFRLQWMLVRGRPCRRRRVWLATLLLWLHPTCKVQDEQLYITCQIEMAQLKYFRLSIDIR